MKVIECPHCGATDFDVIEGYNICKYCGSKYVITKDDIPARTSIIDLNEDIQRLMNKMDQDPSNAGRYAKRILEMDPNNSKAKKYLNGNSSKGCYIATCVYGSYDCPQVWILRRYRDYTLANTWIGRLFIMMYYSISPTFVNWFGKSKWFISTFKWLLDRIVLSLRSKGFKDSPYYDNLN